MSMNNDQDIWNYLVMKSQYDTQGMFIDEKQKSAIVWADQWVRIGQRQTENEDVIRQSVALIKSRFTRWGSSVVLPADSVIEDCVKEIVSLSGYNAPVETNHKL